MERCDYKSLKHHQYRNTTTTAARVKEQYPSFSSTLLDSIYRSIDETSGEPNTPTPMKNNKQVHSSSTSSKNSYASYSKEEDVANYKRACLIEKWMEKKKLASGGEKHTIVRQKSMADFHRASKSSSAMMNLSSSSNSDSSFSSSEAESNNNNAGMNATSSDYKFHQPKPIRTKHQSETAQNLYNHRKHDSSTHQVENLHRQNIKHESYTINNNINNNNNNSSNNNVAAKTKKLTRALKIYNDLKKTKQPISPGGRLASFINSLFTNGNSKKPNNNTTSQHSTTTQLFDANNLTKSSSKSPYSSTCSSASSFSRSCLSKAPKGSSLNNNNNGGSGAKRSVRFYPVSVIVDEDCKPCGHKSLHEDHHHRQTVEQKSRNVDFDMKFVTGASDGDDDDDDDDVTSCTSSDLFELDNLGSIGNDCYREELPVYETTRFDLNRVISKGLIV